MDNPDGSAVLDRGDTVVMDNCGFHHGHFTEGMLRDMFDEYGVRLLFQPAYCPHLNTCELCFNQLKTFLRRFTLLAQQETRIAIAEGISSITAKLCSIFQVLWLLVTDSIMYHINCHTSEYKVNSISGFIIQAESSYF